MNARSNGFETAFRTNDPGMLRTLQIIENIAPSRATVLICGESGTGKEVLARMIHARSPRAARKFCAINCAAIPGELLESELFGHEKGAFTGAHQQKIGKFELANESTFLLDEISELPLLLQAKLLRVIQEGEVERVGGKCPIKINVRLIATTNRDLAKLVEQGSFREDLYYRLNVVPIQVPALRTRPKDIELLARFFLDISATLNGRSGLSFTDAAILKLKQWGWPGNVRELETVIERSILMSASTTLDAHDILIENFAPQVPAWSPKAGMTISQVERELIFQTLDYTKQNRTRAAQLLGISIRTLRNKLHEYNESEDVHVGPL
jgi:two-component system response regulator FlrC